MMKNTKNTMIGVGLLVLAAVMWAGKSHAALINGVSFNSGDLLQTGAIWFNSGPGPGGVKGIGQIDIIRDGDGATTWASGDNGVELNFYFDGLTRVDDQLTPFGNAYGDDGGSYYFFTQAVGTFNVTGDFLADSTGIASGDSWLEALGHSVDHASTGGNDWTITGLITPDGSANSGLGWVDIISGAAFDSFELDQFAVLDSTFADMTFNFATDDTSTGGYDFSGSLNVTAKASPVPEPFLPALMGIGLLGMAGVSRIRKS